MNNLKLTYFNIRGRGEIIRMLLYTRKVVFDDFRVPLDFWFGDNGKKKFDRHIQLPIMTIKEVDHPHIQSGPLFNYFARELDLYGECNYDKLHIDQFLQFYEEMIFIDVPMFVKPEFGKKQNILEKNRKVMYPRLFSQMEELIVSNTRKGWEFCVGRTFSMADIALHVTTQTAFQEAPEVFHKFPGIRAMRAATEEQKYLKDYLNTRPYSSL